MHYSVCTRHIASSSRVRKHGADEFITYALIHKTHFSPSIKFSRSFSQINRFAGFHKVLMTLCNWIAKYLINFPSRHAIDKYLNHEKCMKSSYQKTSYFLRRS